MAELTAKDIAWIKDGLTLLVGDGGLPVDAMLIDTMTDAHSRPPTLAQCKQMLRGIPEYQRIKVSGKKWRANLSQVETNILDGLKGYELFISGSDAGKEVNEDGKKVVKWVPANHGEKVRKDTFRPELDIAEDTGKTLEKSPKRQLEAARAERRTFERTLKMLKTSGDEAAVTMYEKHSDTKTQSAVEASAKMVETWIRLGAADLKIKDPMETAATKQKCYDRAKELEKQEGVTIRECPQYAIRHRNALLKIHDDIQTQKKSAKAKNKKDSVPTPYDASNIKDPASERIKKMRKDHKKVERLFATDTVWGGKAKSVVDPDVASLIMGKDA